MSDPHPGPTGSGRVAAVLCGIGSDVPDRVVDNAELSRRLDTSDEWIRSRTGIAERRHARTGTATSDLAVAAGERALKSAGRASVDAVVLATTTPDMACPGTAPSVADRLGLGHVPAFDVAAVCTGFLYALATAAGLVAAQVAGDVLVIGAETFSTLLDPDDRSTAVIFGDGAGAVVLRAGHPDEPGALGPFDLGSDGGGRDLICAPGGGSIERLSGREPDPRSRYFTMSGRPVFRYAVRAMTESSHAVLRRAGLGPGDVDRVVCHQANARIIAQVSRTLPVPPERVVGNIASVGNTAGASIPLALDHAAANGDVLPGHRVLLTAFGGGLTWGSTLLTWPHLDPA